MTNMKLKEERLLTTLILKGLLADSEELRTNTIYRLTKKQLELLNQVHANVKYVLDWSGGRKMNLHVQEYIVRSGRYHVYRPAYDNIRSAFIAMRAKARQTRNEYRVYDWSTEPETFTETAHLETDNDTYIDVVSDGGARRRFTLVVQRKGEPVPFGHLF